MPVEEIYKHENPGRAKFGTVLASHEQSAFGVENIGGGKEIVMDHRFVPILIGFIKFPSLRRYKSSLRTHLDFE